MYCSMDVVKKREKIPRGEVGRGTWGPVVPLNGLIVTEVSSDDHFSSSGLHKLDNRYLVHTVHVCLHVHSNVYIYM